ncbi:MAG: hypothetical protein U1U88_001833 [Lawsonella clevelandensis]
MVLASAVNDAAREIGAALGIALTGSLLTTFYSDQVTSIANKVRDSLNMAAQMGQGNRVAAPKRTTPSPAVLPAPNPSPNSFPTTQ